jgi:predicted transcriptional regulator
MIELSPKQQALHAVGELPDDATFEDAMERLYFLAKIERGREDARNGRTVPHDDVRKRFGV